MSTHHRDGFDPDASATDQGSAQAGRFSQKLGESAQQVWLASLGAIGRAQQGGSRLFDSLVKEGEAYRTEGRRQAEAGAEAVRESVESRFEQARERANESWQRFGRGFDERVRTVLRSLQLPDRQEVEALRAEVDALKAHLHAFEVRARRGGPGGRRARPSATDGTDSTIDTSTPSGPDQP